jgi:hypothetical protein
MFALIDSYLGFLGFEVISKLDSARSIWDF